MKILNFGWLLLLLTQSLLAQDSLRVTLAQGDSLLLARNLALVASHFEIDLKEAERVQATLFNNPELSTEWSLYNPEKRTWYDAGAQGQKIIALQQVFRIAGQRKVSVKLAAERKQMAVWQFYELARSLKYELHVSFYRYYFLSRAIGNIRSQLALLEDLIENYKDQYTKGNISLQELTRLSTTYFAINNRVTETHTELLQLQKDLKILLAEDRTIVPVITTGDTPALPALTLSDLHEKALHNRPEIRNIESQQLQNELKYKLERKERVPDITAGVVYDQAGSYINHYTGFTVGLQIPLFNRNQGNIRSAQIAIQQSNVLLQSKQQEIIHEVETALDVFRTLQEQYESVGEDFETQLSHLSRGLIHNYSKRNISLLEFTDLFESYNANIIQYNQLKADLNTSYEELNYTVGEDIRR